MRAQNPTKLPGLVVYEPKVYTDNRGYFFEPYNHHTLREHGILESFVQENQSSSHYGVVRGLHYQRYPFAQAKLIRVIEGTILDVVVDLRRGSPTYGLSASMQLSAYNKKQLFIPTGFAHGFATLSETAVVLYKCSTFYTPAAEAGIRYDDPQLAIDWRVPREKILVSDKDKILPSFADCTDHFTYQDTRS